jgi:L-arabinose isomerase
MPKFDKPKIGLLGLMTDGYEPIFAGITRRQEDYAREIVQTLSNKVDVYFPGAAKNRGEIEATVKEFNDKRLDGILIVLLTYNHGAWIIRALQNNSLPLALAAVQPDQQVLPGWKELDLTVNQGIHGAQDNANAITRAGFKCQFFAGNRHEPRFVEFVTDFAKAAQTYTFMRGMKVGVIGKMAGMGDIMGDDMAFYKKIGPEFYHESMGTIYSYMDKITKEEIDAVIERDRQVFDMDPNLSYDSHAYANRLYIAFKKYLEDRGLAAYTAHFDMLGADGRFRQLPLLAASHLLADGYGYAAEGDANCAAMTAAAHCLGDVPNANFTEMYTMDFVEKAIIFCHAGEGNWASCRKDQKPKLIDRYLGEGGLENPPTPIFTPEFGRATLTSLVNVSGDKFRLVVAMGDILPKTDMIGAEMPYIWFRPDSGIEACVEGWLSAGGTHHEVINIGDVSRRWKFLCNMLDIEYVQV